MDPYNKLTNTMAEAVCNYLKRMDESKIFRAIEELGEPALRQLLQTAQQMHEVILYSALNKAIFIAQQQK